MANINKQQSINSFTKGMNKDLDLSILPKESYLHAQNFRLVTNQGSTTTALETIEGNSLLSSALPSGYVVIGSTTIRDEVILFATNNTYSRIYLATLTSADVFTLTLLYDDSVTSDNSRLGFSTSNLIKAIGRYESPDIKKVYWTDGTNRIKFVNYAGGNAVIGSYTAAQFDILPNYIPSTISVDSIGSGSLKSGGVQYSYQLYNLNGAESLASIPTNIIPLSASSQTGVDTLFIGSDQGTNSGKSVSFTIPNIDTGFNRIRVIRLFHNTYVDLPEITIIEETIVTGTSMSFTDNGTQSLGSMTSEEFNFINYDFICKELETKNNILFAANITENIWDIDYDARAYRYSSLANGAISTIYAEDGTSENISFTYSQLLADTIPTYGTVPDTHDCYNLFNEQHQTIDSTANKYKGNGITLGGQGKRTSYNFYTEDIVEYGNTTKIVNNNNHNGSTNSITISEKVSHMRDEIYAYGIVLSNTKGQRSYVKWIGDIRFPSVYDGDNYTISWSFNGGRITNLYIQFTFTGLPADCTSIQLVRCERKAEDRTIVAQGLLGATTTHSSGLFHIPTLIQTTVKEYIAGSQTRSGARTDTLDKTFLTFYSPEISYGNNIDFVAGDKIIPTYLAEVSKEFLKTTNDTTAFIVYNNPFDSLTGTNTTIVSHLAISTSKALQAIYPFSVVDFKIAPYNNALTISGSINSSMQTTVDSTDYENYIRSLGAWEMQGVHGTTGVVKINTSIANFNNTDTDATYGKRFIIANYKRYIKPYGGASYEVRSRREYIPVSDVIPAVAGSATTIVTRGDTYINFFEYQRAMSAGLDGIGIHVDEEFNYTIKFPVESSINTRWSSNKTFTQEYSDTNNIPINRSASLIQEDAGVYSRISGVGGGALSFTQEKNLYSYNSVYSKQNNVVKFYPKPLDVTENVQYDSRVIASDVKINGEEIDSWTKFKLLNFIDVDSKYGSISSLKTDNNNLLFWQSKGFGVLSVNVRSLISDNNTAALILGTGGVLDRYDYISTEAGNISQFGIISGKAGVYWFDSYNKVFYKYGNGVEPLSKIKGIQSYLNTFANKETICTGLHDTKFTENIFTLNNGTSKTTIAYNEIIDGFTSFYSYTPSIYIGLFDGRYITQNNTNSLYLHNSGVISEFYEQGYTSYVTLVANENYQYSKIFDSISYKTKVLTGSIELFEPTFNTLKIYNSKQNTGDVTLDTTNTTKREGSFNTVIPRNAVNSNIETDVDILNPTNLNTSRLFRERIRDKYSIITLTYDNTDGYKLSVPYVITNYRISYR